MSTQDAHDDYESSSTTNIDAKLDRYKENNAKTKSSSKSKDVSHVPCKFFKVGSCTAGSSCPFSHQVQQPGQQKDVCAWFVKGNCKFGHKCALAHILPGQSPAMDRRNKKAAQLAAAAAGNTSSSGNNSTTGGTGSAAPKDRDRDRDRTGDSRNNRKPTSISTHSSGRGGSSSRSNTLLSGSTAPTRMLSAGARPPLPISISKAAPAPAETAPALRDADFTSRDTPIPRGDDQAQNGANAQQQHSSREGDTREENVDSSSINPGAIVNPAYGNGVDAGVGLSSPPPKPTAASPFPVSTPPRPHRFTARHGSSPSIDFGPVGSPPRASPSTHHHHHHHHHHNAANSSSPIRINGFSPGTSPRDPVQGTQPLAAPTADPPFSAPGANLFASPSSPRGNTGGSGLLAASLSLGTAAAAAQSPPQMQTQPFAVGSLPVLSRPIADSTSYAEALDDEDMEDLVPSSLKDLLTPEEQSRRMSRTSSSRTGVLGIGGMGGEGTGVAGGIPTAVQRSGVQREDTRHRHSRSVPGASLLSQDLRSIWSDTPGAQDPNPGFGGLSPPTGIGVLGTSPSFGSSPGLHAFDKDGPSPSMLSPTNASAAFLGLHHYMSGAGGHPSRVPGGISAVRAVSQGNIHHQTGLSSTGNAGLNVLPSASSSFDARAHSHLHAHGHGLSSSPSHSHTQFANRPAGTSAFNAFSSSPSQYTTSLSAHHVSGTTQGVSAFRSGVGASTGGPEQALSPASRALQAHVPGQSLPQGLAAGFSRIHLQPAAGSPGAAFSPGSASISGSFFGNSNGTGTDASGVGTNGGTGAEWLGSTPTNQTSPFSNGTLSAVNNTTAASEQSQLSASGVAPASNANVPDQQPQPPRSQIPTTADVGGLTSMFSHLSYSSVAAGGLRGHSPNSIPTSVSRRGSGRSVGGVGAGPGGWGGPGVGGGNAGVHPHPLSSPLSGPVLTNDDDDLFSMDEEK